jgi:hypothetical protein
MIDISRYSELINLLYSSTSFHLVDLDAANAFLSSTLCQRLSSIKSLHISWHIDTISYLTDQATERFQADGIRFDPHAEDSKWENVWRILSSMTGQVGQSGQSSQADPSAYSSHLDKPSLQNLNVNLFNYGFALNLSKLLAPLYAMKAEHFTVELKWNSQLRWNSQSRQNLQFEAEAAGAPFVLEISDDDEGELADHALYYVYYVRAEKAKAMVKKQVYGLLHDPLKGVYLDPKHFVIDD